MDAAVVGPCEFEHVIKVVGDAEEFFLPVVRRRDGVNQQVCLGGCAHDVAVAVRTVAQHGTSDVRAVAVVVLRVITARAQTEGGTGGCRWREGQNAGDVVAEVWVHVGIVDPVVKPRIGNGDDDAASIEARPRGVNTGHVGAAPRVIYVHDLDAF